MTRPNILLIFTDQMRGDVLDDGSPVIAPALRRLAAAGVRFSRCISNAPLCVPARAALMTGQRVRECGVWSNRKGASELGPSHVRAVRDAGYLTAAIGKLHLWHPKQEPAFWANALAGGAPTMHVNEMDEVLATWGFEERIEVGDPIQTAIVDCHYTDYLASKGLLEAHRAYIMAWFRAAYDGGDPRPWDQSPAPVPAGDDIDSFIGKSALTWLQDYDQDDPFYLQVQFTGPHDPFDGPLTYRALYDEVDIDTGIPAHPESLSRANQARLARWPAVANATAAQRRQFRVNYYANVTLIDEWVGRLMDVLQERDRLRDTWVIFASDHGELLGDHGLWNKANFYRQAIHVPCLLTPPGRVRPGNGTGWTSSALVEHIDLTATILDIAGASQLEGALGASLLPYLDMRSDDPAANRGKPAILSELFGDTTVVTTDHKLTVRAEDNAPRALFDLAADPNELQDVLDAPGSDEVVARLRDEYLLPAGASLNRGALADYRRYVRDTGRIN